VFEKEIESVPDGDPVLVGEIDLVIDGEVE
jgi:hypothetical protein